MCSTCRRKTHNDSRPAPKQENPGRGRSLSRRRAHGQLAALQASWEATSWEDECPSLRGAGRPTRGSAPTKTDHRPLYALRLAFVHPRLPASGSCSGS